MKRESFMEALDGADKIVLTFDGYTVGGYFTNGRVDRSTVAHGWFVYDIRGKDDDPGEFGAIEQKEVAVNHAGTLILDHELVFNDEGYIELTEESINFI